MKSKVIRLFDYEHAVYPDELIRWRWQPEDEKELEKKLEHLAQDSASEVEAEEIQEKDSVACTGESEVERWNQPLLLFYPGYGLCEKPLEDALIGMKKGETKTIQIPEGQVTLTVRRIVRSGAGKSGDELIREEGIEGVKTVEDYRNWFRAKTEKERKEGKQMYITAYLINEIPNRSEFDIDEEEEKEWTWDWVNHRYENDARRGIDWRIRDDQEEPLSEAEAKEQMMKEFRQGFAMYLAFREIAEQVAGLDPDTIHREGIKAILQGERERNSGIETEEELLKKNGTSVIDLMLMEMPARKFISDYVAEHIDQILED